MRLLAVDPDDSVELADWVGEMRRAFGQLVSPSDLTNWSERSRVAPLLWLRTDDGEAVATAWPSPRRLSVGDGDHLRVTAWSNLAVIPRWRGRGIFTVLVDRLLARSTAAGADAVVLRSEPGLYERYGFSVLTWENDVTAQPPVHIASESANAMSVSVSAEATPDTVLRSLFAAVRDRPGEIDRPGDWVTHDRRRTGATWTIAEGIDGRAVGSVRHLAEGIDGRAVGSVRHLAEGIDGRAVGSVRHLAEGTDGRAVDSVRHLAEGTDGRAVGSVRRLADPTTAVRIDDVLVLEPGALSPLLWRAGGSGPVALEGWSDDQIEHLALDGWRLTDRRRRPGVWIRPLSTDARCLVGRSPALHCSSRF